MKFILSIDQGTTGTKAVIVDENGSVKGRGYQAHQQFHPNPGWVEHDVEEIWNCILLATRDALKDGDVAPEQIAAVALANQGETVVAFSRRTGDSLYPAIVWSDRRTSDIAEVLQQDAAFTKIVSEVTGLRIDPYFSATKMQWLLQHVDEVKQALLLDDLCISTLDAWMMYRLTGGKTYVSDTSTASRTLLLNIHTLQYEPSILDRLGIPGSILPDVVDTVGCHGETDPEAFLGIRAPIVVSLVDQPSALFGQLCLQAGDAKCTYGTGCFLYMNTGHQPVQSSHGMLTSLVWSNDSTPTYALDGGVYSAGSAMDWLHQIGLLQNRADLHQVVSTTTSSNGVWFVPALTGLAAPHWDSDARGCFFGLSSATTREDMVNAVLEGIAHRVADVVEAMEAESNRALEVLRVDGGLTNIPALMQFQSDILGIPIEVSADHDATALGAAYQAALHLEWIDMKKLLSFGDVSVRYEPQRGQAWREDIRRRWKEIVGKVLTSSK